LHKHLLNTEQQMFKSSDFFQTFPKQTHFYKKEKQESNPFQRKHLISTQIHVRNFRIKSKKAS
jgi:hypothetical protein